MNNPLCERFGHKWDLWKCDGQTFMKCENCPAIRDVTAYDLGEDRITLPKKKA